MVSKSLIYYFCNLSNNSWNRYIHRHLPFRTKSNRVIMRIFIIRHAESTANASGVLAGRSAGVDLSETGESQAKRLREIFNTINMDLVISSPIQRCLTTAKIAVPHYSEFDTDASFTELDFGDWTGLKLSDLTKKESWTTVQNTPGDFRFPNGESFVELRNRVSFGFSKLVEKYQDKSNVVLFTHADVIKMLVSWLLDSDINKFQRIVIDPASISIVSTTNQDFSLRGINLDANSERIQKEFKDGNN